MGLFQGKHQSKKKSPADAAQAEAQAVFDDQYRQELRDSGRQYFHQVIENSADLLSKEMEGAMSQVSADLKDYLTKRLDATINDLNTTLTKQLNDRLADHDRLARDANDQAVQALNRSAQMLHEKSQQLGAALQQAIATQQAAMTAALEENKTQLMTTQKAQAAIVQSLRDGVETTKEQSQQLSAGLQKALADQEALLAKVYQDTMARINATSDAQDQALRSLNQSAAALAQQYQQLSTTLQKTTADQEAMLVGAFEDNMAQIVEHYLLGALGDQFDMKAQLPLIIKQMETNKQAIVDDMKL